MNIELHSFIQKRFTTESIEVNTTSVNDGDLVLLTEYNHIDPCAVVYVKNSMMRVGWIRDVELSDYQKNRFQFQLYHLVRDYNARAAQYQRVHGGD